jgi:hypothetical protein
MGWRIFVSQSFKYQVPAINSRVAASLAGIGRPKFVVVVKYDRPGWWWSEYSSRKSSHLVA